MLIEINDESLNNTNGDKVREDEIYGHVFFLSWREFMSCNEDEWWAIKQ